jgi:PAS domain S-box-containing protein
MAGSALARAIIAVDQPPPYAESPPGVPSATPSSDRDPRGSISRRLTAVATTSLFMLDAENRCIFMNPAAETLTGLSFAETSGRSCHELFHHLRPDGSPYPAEECPIVQSLLLRQPLTDRLEHFVRRDGSFVPVLCTSVPIIENGVFLGVALEARDLSSQLEAQASLRHSEQRYRSLIEATAAIVWTTTAAGEFLPPQPAWSAFTGQSEEEYSGTGWIEPIHPDDREETISVWRAALQNRTKYEVEQRLRCHDGVYRQMLLRGVPILDSDGGVREWVGTHTDITDQHALRRDLELERVRLREILTAAPAVIATLRGPGHVFEFANPAYLRLVERDVVGKPVREALPELAGQGFFELLDNVYSTGEPFIGREVKVTVESSAGAGQDYYLDFVYQPLHDASGAVTGIFVHGVDVTQQVMARQRIEEQRAEGERNVAEMKYQVLLNKTITDNAASCLFMLDERGHPTFMNAAAERVTGFTLPEISDRPLHDSIHSRYPDGRPYPMEQCPIDRSSAQITRLKDYRDIFISKQGSFFPVSCHVAPLERDGRTLGAVLEFRDISEQLRAETVLREADRRKNEFLATLSHELRTPMTSILGWSRILEMGENDADTVQAASASIFRSAVVQAQLIDDLLDVSRIITGKLRIDSTVVDLSSVCSGAIETVRPSASEKNIELFTELDPAVPRVTGDPNRLQQVIWNLLTNAIKFSPGGSRVTLRTGTDGAKVFVSVIDEGSGIGPEFVPYVFEPFRQAESSTTRSHGGLGLGLAIVNYLTELHGGTVSVSSDGEGKGATFTIELPAATETEREEEAAPDESQRSRAELPERIEGALEGWKVVVIDDSPEAREFTSAMVLRGGAEVRTAASVDAAIFILETFTPDAILCDIAMPGRDGYDFIRWLRESRLRHLPVLAVTAFGGEDERQRILTSGFDHYLRKPFDPHALIHCILETRRRTG